MPRGPEGEKRPADVVGNAVHVMRIATGEIEDSVPVRNFGNVLIAAIPTSPSDLPCSCAAQRSRPQT